MDITSTKMAIEFSQSSHTIGREATEIPIVERERSEEIVSLLKQLDAGERDAALVALERLSWSYGLAGYSGIPLTLVDALKKDGSFEAGFIDNVSMLLERQQFTSAAQHVENNKKRARTLSQEYGENTVLKYLMNKEGDGSIRDLLVKKIWLKLASRGFLLDDVVSARGGYVPAFAKNYE